MLKRKLFVFILSLFLFIFNFYGINKEITLKNGKGVFLFNKTQATKIKPVNVFYYNPFEKENNEIKNAPVLFVMHGLSRNADGYREVWIKYAEKYKVLLIVPEFTTHYYPGSRAYNLGDMYSSNDKLQDKSLWAFTVVEDIFDEIIKITNNTNKSYYIYGHSAGGQFVHRFVTFYPEARIKKAVSANAGWYTLIDFRVEFPYGLKNSPIEENVIKKVFNKNIIILLGTEDTNPNDKSLNKTNGAMMQGKHRFERGHYYYKKAQGYCKNNNIAFIWELKEVKGARHSNSQMAESAAKILFEE